MAKTGHSLDDHDDKANHVVRLQYDVLSGWAVASCLALAIVLGFWRYPPLHFSPELSLEQPVKLDPVGLPFIEQERGSLADELGMTRQRAE
jgi:hypothetical protein